MTLEGITIQHRTALWVVLAGMIVVGRYHTQAQAQAGAVLYAETGLTQGQVA